MINIAIDGPSGAGKSTVSKAVASTLGYIYIDTGAMYRTLAYKAINLGISISKQADKVENMLKNTTLDIRHAPDGQHMYLDGEDVTAFIRTSEVSMGASAISAIPFVRSWLLDMQRSFARENNCIMDGRDIGTVVLPHSDVKIFLTASPEARAKRRYAELVEKGQDVNFQKVLEDMIKRDEDDTNRACAPLAAAQDAVYLDSQDLTFEETVEKILDIIQKRIGE